MNYSTAASALIQAYAQRRQAEIQAKFYEHCKQHNELMARLHRETKPKPVTRNAHKCPGCGSHEFKLHAGRNVCVYCRTSQSVAAPALYDGAGMIP